MSDERTTRTSRNENLKPNPDPTPDAVAHAIRLLVHDGYRDEADLLQALLQRNDALLDALDRLFQDMAAISMAGLAAKASDERTTRASNKPSGYDPMAGAIHDEFPPSHTTAAPDYYEAYLRAEKQLDKQRAIAGGWEATAKHAEQALADMERQLAESERRRVNAEQRARRWQEAYKLQVTED